MILDEILGIKDLRSDKRIDFVGGLRGLGELKRRVTVERCVWLLPCILSLCNRLWILLTVERLCLLRLHGSSLSYAADSLFTNLNKEYEFQHLYGIDEYKTITNKIGEGTYSEKRSKFLAFSHHVETLDEVKEIVASYRKNYYDARHVCYAYMLGAERTEFRANDDGEPSSTAGKPILGQINSNDLTDILIIVVRYYGGVNLGTGGLIVAYKAAAALAIEDSVQETRQVEELVKYDFPYVMMNDVMRVVKEMQPRIVSQNMTTPVLSLSLSVNRKQRR